MQQNAQYNDQKKQRRCYSGKKRCHTAKGQIVVDSNQRIICTQVSMGNMHDFKLLKNSKLPLKKETKVCVDSGYVGFDKIHKRVELPKKKTKLHPLTKEDKKENRIKASIRIIVEHINAKLKTFKILSEKYRNRRKRFSLRFDLICALVNWDRGFVKI